LLSLAEAKEKILMALSARKLVERGWLTALLGYLAKREEVEVRLKYIGDLRLQRKDFGALAILTYLCGNGMATVRFDYRNHGDSSGPFEDFNIDNAIEDAVFMVKYALGLEFVNPSRVAFLGLSMGGYITLRTYERMSMVPRALVLLSPAIDFSGLGRVVEQGLRGDYVYFGPYRLRLNNVIKLANSNAMSVAELVNVPILIIHSVDDKAVPYQQSVEFHSKVKHSDKALMLLDKSGHTFDDYEVRVNVINTIVKWLGDKLKPT